MHLGVFPPWVHTIFEWLAIFIGMRLMGRFRQQDFLPSWQRTWVVVGCILGAAIGSKVIVWLDHPALFLNCLKAPWMLLMAGKGLGGAIVGGWLGVELSKRYLGIRRATGDLFVFPLLLAIVIGRMGCFLCGYYDKTYGVLTALPWGVDFGDGFLRHPTQLYEIIWLSILALFLWQYHKKPYAEGNLFRFFMVGYFFFRFWVEWIKPIPHSWYWMNGTQLLSVGVLTYYAIYITRQLVWKNTVQILANGVEQNDG